MPRFTQMIDILLPPLCAGCRVPVPENQTLCVTCWQKLAWITGPICSVSGVPMPYDLGPDMVSPAVLAKPPAYDWARSAAFYRDQVAALIRRMKFSDDPDLALIMARWLLRLLPLGQPRDSLIAPVPLHRWRFIRRRYNQSALLGQHLAALSGFQFVPDLLRRRRATEPQTSLSRHRRHANVRGAFSLGEKYASDIVGKSVILVDDVITTGSTIEACAQVLRRSGATSIGVVSVARVLH
jgi:ComF family protein